jgi:hypothetical protein
MFCRREPAHLDGIEQDAVLYSLLSLGELDVEGMVPDRVPGDDLPSLVLRNPDKDTRLWSG